MFCLIFKGEYVIFISVGGYCMIVKKAKLGEVALIKVGYQSRTKIPEDPHGSHFLIQGKDFNDLNKLQVSSLIKFNPDKKSVMRYVVSQGNILFQARGSRHFAYHISEPFESTVAASTFYIIELKDQNVLPGYIAWWLNRDQAKVLFQDSSSKGISFISSKSLSEVMIPIPPIEAQQKIEDVEILWQREQGLRNQLSQLRGRLVEAFTIKQSRQ
jgi:restriction endonuclease S subunit